MDSVLSKIRLHMNPFIEFRSLNLKSVTREEFYHLYIEEALPKLGDKSLRVWFLESSRGRKDGQWRGGFGQRAALSARYRGYLPQIR